MYYHTVKSNIKIVERSKIDTLTQVHDFPGLVQALQ